MKEEIKMFLGDNEIIGIDKGFEMGEGVGLGTFSFSGTYSDQDPILKDICQTKSKPTKIKFYFMKDSIEQYWNNVLFRMFIGPPEMVEEYIEIIGKFGELTQTINNGKVSLSINGTVL